MIIRLEFKTPDVIEHFLQNHLPKLADIDLGLSSCERSPDECRELTRRFMAGDLT